MDNQIDLYYEQNLNHEKYCFVCGNTFNSPYSKQLTCCEKCYQVWKDWRGCAKDWYTWGDLMRIASTFKKTEYRDVVYRLLSISVANRKSIMEGTRMINLNIHEPTEKDCADAVRFLRDDYDQMNPATQKRWQLNAYEFLICWQKVMAKNNKKDATNE